MSLIRPLTNIAIWLAVFAFWFFLSRPYHPTLLIDALATAMLVTVAALTVYVNSSLLVPRFWKRGLHGQYAGALLLTIAVLALIAVVLIGWMYDALWGPDPARFGFGTNFVYECVFISIHFVGALGLMKLAGWFRQHTHQPVEE
jgi:hypothetical protein